MTEGCFQPNFPLVLGGLENALTPNATSNPVKKTRVKMQSSYDECENGLHFAHKTLARQRANQFAHFERQQGAGELSDR